jgi:hypothetical protein
VVVKADGQHPLGETRECPCAGFGRHECGQNNLVWRDGLGCVPVEKAGGRRAGPHKDGYNLLCADTHAKWYRPETAINLSHFPEDIGKSTKAAHPKANPRCFD